MQIRPFIKILLLLFILGCNKNPYRTSNRIYKQQAKELSKTLRHIPLKDSIFPSSLWVGTTNFNLRKPNFVIIHHTAQNSCSQTLKTFTRPATQVSAHYVICKDGTIFHMLNNYFRAWHGGVASWGNVSDINSVSLGIELDNNGSEPFTLMQINSLLKVLAEVKKAYNIPATNFIGHSDIAPNRKVDPSKYFPWQLLATNGFGMWYSDTTGLVVPSNFKPLDALKIIGYNTKDSLASMRAFKLHFLADTTLPFNEADKKVLFSLYTKY